MLNVGEREQSFLTLVSMAIINYRLLYANCFCEYMLFFSFKIDTCFDFKMLNNNSIFTKSKDLM